MYDYQFSFVVIGDSAVGKSCLLQYFSDGKVADGTYKATVGIDYFSQEKEIEPGIFVRIDLWDTTGLEKFRSIARSYYRNSCGVVLVYDISDRRSFESLESWILDVNKHSPDSVSFVLVGNKVDQESQRRVTYREGKVFADTYGIPFFETSALTGKNVSISFQTLAQRVYRKLTRNEIAPQGQGVKATREPTMETFLVTEKAPPRNRCCF